MFEQDKEIAEGMIKLGEETEEKAGEFLKKAFEDMVASAKAQHEIDKANFEAVKAETKARHAAAVGSHKDQLAEAKERLAKAQEALEKLEK